MSSPRSYSLPQFFEVKGRIELLEMALATPNPPVPFLVSTLDKQPLLLISYMYMGSCPNVFIYPHGQLPKAWAIQVSVTIPVHWPHFSHTFMHELPY